MASIKKMKKEIAAAEGILDRLEELDKKETELEKRKVKGEEMKKELEEKNTLSSEEVGAKKKQNLKLSKELVEKSKVKGEEMKKELEEKNTLSGEEVGAKKKQNLKLSKELVKTISESKKVTEGVAAKETTEEAQVKCDEAKTVLSAKDELRKQKAINLLNSEKANAVEDYLEKVVDFQERSLAIKDEFNLPVSSLRKVSFGKASNYAAQELTTVQGILFILEQKGYSVAQSQQLLQAASDMLGSCSVVKLL